VSDTCICTHDCPATEDGHYVNCPAHAYYANYKAMIPQVEAQQVDPTFEDMKCATAIISQLRGYVVRISKEHSVTHMVARHRAAAFEAGRLEGVREAAEVAANYAEPNGNLRTDFNRGYENSAGKIAHRLRALSKEPTK
jgi:hypothetical protein